MVSHAHRRARRAASVSWPIGSNCEPVRQSCRRLAGPERGKDSSGGSRLPLAGIFILILSAVFISSPTHAQTPSASPPKPADEKPIREIYVPFEDLNVILDNDHQRVFLTREEYDELVKAAKAKPKTPAPHKAALLAAQYEGRLEDGRALLTGRLTIDVLEEGLWAFPLDLAGVGIRSATLDGAPAPLSHNPQRQVIVLVQGKGLHELELQLTAPVQTAAAQQTLQVTVPSYAATRLKLSVPGDVDVKGGAAVVSRSFDMASGRTRLELLPQKGGMAIVLSLNNRLLQEQRVLVARSVIVDEVTQGYERIHATVSYRVLHGAVEKLRLAVPAGFDVMQVDSVLLARWQEMTDEGGRKIIEATLREPTSEQIVLHLTANRSPTAGADWLAGLADWRFPRLDVLDTAGQVAVIGLLVEDRLKPETIDATDLVPIDSAALAGAIPASVLKAEPGAPVVRQVAAFYAPAADYALSARFARPPTDLIVAGNSLLVIGDEGLSLQGGFALTPAAENLFLFSFTLPAGWQLMQVTAADGTPLPVERYPRAAGGTRLVVRLPAGIPAGRTQTVNYQASLTPPGWLAEWTTQQVEFPEVLVEGATSDSGAIAAQTIDDLVVRPATLSGLTPLLDNEKAAFGLGNIPTALAYRYDNRDFAAGLVVDRTAPSLTAQAFSFFKLQRDNLAAHYELNYDVREARARQLAFSLPVGTPAELTIQGLGGTVVKEFTSQVQGQRRRWSVQLAQQQAGSVRLAIDFTQRLPEAAQRSAPLPLIEAEDVEYQSALVAVEGDAELDVSLSTTAREVDIGELSGAEYALGRRVIGTFGHVGTGTEARATVTPRDPHTLPPALIQRAELVTKVSAGGLAQSVARYDLLTKATLLEIRLRAESTLWTVYLDDQPTKPQREEESLLLSLPAQPQLAVRKLQIVYETPSTALGLSGTIDAVAPQLLVRAAGTDSEREIPQADLEWQLILPSGYSVRRSDGTVETDELPPRELAAWRVARFLIELGGGIRPWYAREAARRASLGNNLRQLGLAFEDLAAPAAEEPAPAESAPPPPLAAPVAEDMPAQREAAKEALADELRAAVNQAKDVQSSSGTIVVSEAGRAGVVTSRDDAKKLWALEGVSTLQIEIQRDAAPATTFRSLGDQPRLVAAVIDQRRVAAAAWGLALLVFLVGAGMTLQPAAKKAAFIIIVLVAASVPPLLTTAFDEVALAFDYVFFAGCALIVWYLAAAIVLAIGRWLASKLPAGCCQPAAVQQVAAVFIAALLMAGANRAAAQEPPLPESVRITNLSDLLPFLEHDVKPVAIPADAVIVPYDPEKPIDHAASEKILVPYAKYVELWNLAHPDKRIDAVPPPVEYALAATAYEAMLAAGDFLPVTGRMQIDVYSDKPIAVPLALAGGVLERANVDGQAARLQVVEASGVRERPEAGGRPSAAQAQGADSPRSPTRLFLLHLSGKGRKSVELHVRLGLARQGGWRIVRGQLPAGPATALTLIVPEAGTEIRQSSLADRPTFEIKTPGERIETALGAGGQLDLQWRPKVAEGMVDQALTARSLAVFDVREDSLRMAWQLRLEFGRAYRDAFSLTAPAEYLVESVSGDNVRGWTATPMANQQRIDVTLLKPAQGSESLTLQLARRGRVGQGELAEFDAPAILVEGAALEQGQIAVRKSPRLELRTLAAAGLSRADSGGQFAAIEKLADAADAAVLAMQPYQAFRYVRPPFRLTLAAGELPSLATAEVRAALRIAERDTTLDAAVTFRPQGQPLYRVRLYLPDGFSLDRFGPDNLEWSITTENNRQLLTVQLLDGRTGEFSLTLFGKIATPTRIASEGQAWTMPAPRLEIVDVEKQEGEIVILPDPDTNVRVDNLRNCEAAPLTGGTPWMKADQQPLAKAVLRYRTADYAATLTLTPRLPLVSARTITNIKITPRSIEETLLVHFRIEQAGIRRVALLVPEHLQKARLKALLVKQKTIAAATTADGQPIAGMVRLTLELQDYVRGEYAILLEHDRLLASEKQTIGLPVVQTGRTDRRLVSLENAGRDEIVIDPSDIVGLEPVNRQQQAWRDLAAVLGDNVTQAYAALDSAAQPSLAFTTLRRQEAERSRARIGLATTLLVVDASGTYRALVQYRVSNASEQFLELTLPAGARLWTALVAGEPVKPAQAVPPQPGVVRIPLVKTAEGEGDYLVELKYGGRMATSAGLGAVNFPLIRQTSINVELSQVRLLLPQSQQWFNFDGTMRYVADERELAAGFQAYLGKRIQEAVQSLQSASAFTKVRAAVSLKQSRMLFDDSLSLQAGGEPAVDTYSANAAVLEQAEQQVQQQLALEQREQSFDNRGRLNEYFYRQDVERSKNVVSELGSNFETPQLAAGKAPAAEALNPEFLEQNRLKTPTDGLETKPREPARPDAAAMPEGKVADARVRGLDRFADNELRLESAQQAGQRAPDIAAKKELDELQRKLQEDLVEEQAARRSGAQLGDQLQKYRQSLETDLARQGQGQAQQPHSGGAFGYQPGAYGVAPKDQSGQLGDGARRGGFGRAAIPPTSGPMAMGGLAGQPGDASRPEVTAAVPFAAGEEFAQVAAGLASLDVPLPERGKLYRFTTPRGEVQITARSIPVVAVSRLMNLVGLLAALFVLSVVIRQAPRLAGLPLFRSTLGGLGVAVLGLASVLAGILPVVGLLGIVIGLVIAIRAFRGWRTSRADAAH